VIQDGPVSASTACDELRLHALDYFTARCHVASGRVTIQLSVPSSSSGAALLRTLHFQQEVRKFSSEQASPVENACTWSMAAPNSSSKGASRLVPWGW